MPTKYIVDDDKGRNDKAIIVNDDMTMRSKYGKPFTPEGGGSWKLLGYLPAGKKSMNDLTSEFKSGCHMVFADYAEESLSYESSRLGKFKLLEWENPATNRTVMEKLLQKPYVSKPVKEMIGFTEETEDTVKKTPKSKKDTEPKKPGNG